jgi:hypothetical protein
MMTLCSWCGDTIDSGPAREVAEMSHGLCLECHGITMSKHPEDLSTYLDRLDPPVFLVDEAGRVVLANTAACTASNKTRQELTSQFGGVVMECVFADLPGGCGNTVHCKACAIRISVSLTHSTKKGIRREPATLTTYLPGVPTRIRYLISTEWTRSGVMLRVDEIVAQRPLKTGKTTSEND